jgi:hypothetical protein
MGSTSNVASIIDHLGGEKFLTSLGARDFVADDTHLGFTLIHNNPKGVHSVTISVEPSGGFKVSCYGGLEPGTFHAATLATERVVVAESLAAVVGKLTGIDALRDRHL